MENKIVFKNEKMKKLDVRWAILISFVFHAIVVVKHIEYTAPKIVPNKKPKKIRLVLTPKVKRPSMAKQIVNNEQKGKKEKAKDAKFLGKTDQKYDRQTTTKNIGSFKKAGLGEKTAINKRIVKSQMQQKKKSKKNKLTKNKMAKRTKAKKKSKKLTMADLAIGSKVVKFEETQDLTPEMIQGLKNGEAGQSGLSANNDFIEDLPLGDMTNLNTIEYKYYGFYHRIRQKLEQYWGDSLRKKAEKLYKSGRSIASDDNKITSLIITLDSKGNIVDILIKGTSGINELDQAAIEAFNRAGPFPNPPRGMLKGGKADIEWGFVVRS